MKISKNIYRSYQTCIIKAKRRNSFNKTYYVPYIGYNFRNLLICIKLREDIQFIKKKNLINITNAIELSVVVFYFNFAFFTF